MTTIWLIIFLVASGTFFVIAGYIAVVGLKDLRILLSRSDRKET